MRKLTHQELLKRQALQKEERLPFVAVVNNVRSLYNVGSIFRTADGVGVEKIYLCGITGIPPSEKISKTALDAEKVVPWEYREKATDALRELKEQGYQIIFLEQTSKSIPYQNFHPKDKIALVIGNEITGVSDSLLELCDQALEIEMAGLKNSLNVTVAFGIVGYFLRHGMLSQKFSQ